MSIERVLVIATVVVFAVLVLAWQGMQIREADRIVADALDDDGWVYDGPDSMRLLEDTERYVDRIEARDRRLRAGFARMPAYQPREEEA